LWFAVPDSVQARLHPVHVKERRHSDPQLITCYTDFIDGVKCYWLECGGLQPTFGSEVTGEGGKWSFLCVVTTK
jgi:hypothetical protein